MSEQQGVTSEGLSMIDEHTAYEWLYRRVTGNGTVHFDSDAMEPEEPWVRYFARLMVRFAHEHRPGHEDLGYREERR